VIAVWQRGAICLLSLPYFAPFASLAIAAFAAAKQGWRRQAYFALEQPTKEYDLKFVVR
jgi:hypothetical protein